ncbi:M42 family metallopeptidase [Flexithrix dorotheae]|uniref:M42 family metallopeptidase n=1 Tax=Flexithrix dorotheae TaxID=70993 RepID=UPI00036756AA|nr:M42 family metallopeptidase [Flexithrix dorotheae]
MSEYNYQSLKNLIEIDSPSGYTRNAANFIMDKLKSYGYAPFLTNKGAVKCHIGENPRLAIAGHIDTLGAIISKINPNGTLSFSLIGGLSLNSAEGEYVNIYTLSGKRYTGTILLNDPAAHANKNLNSTERAISKMHIRLDEVVKNGEEVQALGINVGDFACLDTNYQETTAGFIKSRFLDNKAGCFVMLEMARILAGKPVKTPVELFFSNYEEVGHGAAGGFDNGIEELLVIDMGVVGDACEGKETHCSICAKDSSGPYDYEMRKKLVELAEASNIPYKIDVYPFYGSDGSAALRAGNNFRVGLIGPGVAASHGNERTHKQGIEATIDLCLAYINQ